MSEDPKKMLKNKIKYKLEEELANELSEMSITQFTPISWKEYFSNEFFIFTEYGKFRILTAGHSGPCVFLIHGAGSSATTWALFTREILKYLNLRIFALDLRGHGFSFTNDSENLSKEQLVKDINSIIEELITKADRTEGVIIIGHSLGGALAIWLSSLNLNYNIKSLIVIDVDEDGALNIDAMLRSIDDRPKFFKSINHGIRYSYTQRKIKNLEADRATFPGQLTYQDPKNPVEMIWKVDLFNTRKFWEDWFSGVSKTFVSLKIPRLLIVSNKDRVDKNILIGQMQGLFRVEPIEKCGHTVHEDDPIETMKSVVTFLKSQRII